MKTALKPGYLECELKDNNSNIGTCVKSFHSQSYLRIKSTFKASADKNQRKNFSHKIKLFGCQFLTSRKEYIKENAGTLSEVFFTSQEVLRLLTSIHIR